MNNNIEDLYKEVISYNIVFSLLSLASYLAIVTVLLLFHLKKNIIKSTYMYPETL